MSGDTAATLHPIERSILKSLARLDNVSADLLAGAELTVDQVRRGIEWLKFKNLVSIKESSVSQVYRASGSTLGGLPERRLINSVKEGKGTISEVVASGALKNEEINAAIA